MKFYLETPTIERKEDALEYLNEFVEYGSEINGSGGLDKCLKGLTYEEWLDRLDKMSDPDYAASINKCPSKTFFFVSEEDKRIIGMINIRYNLTEAMLKFGGHIGYGIRPTERQKGYNKINLYLGLLKAREEFGLDRVMLDCSVTNLGSDGTIRALGGVLEKCEMDPNDNTLTNAYWIDVDESIEKYRDEYIDKISEKAKVK